MRRTQPPHRHDEAGSSLPIAARPEGAITTKPRGRPRSTHTLHQATIFHALDVMGDPGAFPLQQPGDLADSHPALGIVGEVDQDPRVPVGGRLSDTPIPGEAGRCRDLGERKSASVPAIAGIVAALR